MVKTLTYDTEISEHAATDKALASLLYFADPYSSWQARLNENLNGNGAPIHPEKPSTCSWSPTKSLRMIQDQLKYSASRQTAGHKTLLKSSPSLSAAFRDFVP